MIDQLGELAAVLLAASLASERLVVMVKTLAPSLLSLEEANGANSRKHSERRRRLIVMVASLIASTLTVGFLAEDVSGVGDYFWNLLVGHVRVAGQDWPVLVLGLLASGGSAFWAQVVGYASAVKDIRRVERTNLEAGRSDAVASPTPFPTSLKQAARRHLKDMHGDAFEFLADGAVQTTSAGVSVVHLQQVHEGIPIFDGALLVRFDRADQVIGTRGTPTPISPDSLTIPAISASRARGVQERHMAQGARMIPGAARLGVAPVHTESVHLETFPLEHAGYERFDLDWSTLRPFLANTPRKVGLGPDDLLGGAVYGSRLPLMPVPKADDMRVPGSWIVEEGGVVCALALWFELELHTGGWLSNAPRGDEEPWGQWLLPVDPPLVLAPGQELEASVWRESLADGSPGFTVWECRVGDQVRRGHEFAGTPCGLQDLVPDGSDEH